MTVRELKGRAERREAVPILRELWTDTESEAIFEWTAEDRYHLFGRFDDGDLVGVAGVLDAGHLHHVDHAWLYDLVVDADRRGAGHGTALLEFVESWASDCGYEHLALASPLSKTDTHAFYEERGYETWGYVLEREV